MKSCFIFINQNVLIMILIAVLCIQFSIMVSALVANTLGIYTFHRRKKGNKKQHLLLQNLASVECFKTIYDIVNLCIYYFFNDRLLDTRWFFIISEVRDFRHHFAFFLQDPSQLVLAGLHTRIFLTEC